MIQIIKNKKNEPKSLKDFKTKKKDKKSKSIYDQNLLIKREKDVNKKKELREILRGDKNGRKGKGTFEFYIEEYGNKKLREILLKEQGYICCYCMGTISMAKEGRAERTKIEHYKPRDGNEECEIDYDNLYLACSGVIKGCSEKDNIHSTYKDCKCYEKKKNNQIKHCDTCKDNRSLKYIKLNEDIESKILYDSDGRIYSEDKNINNELNEILNLNAKQLKFNRMKAKEDFFNFLIKALPTHGTWDNSLIENQIIKCKNDVKKRPYVGIILYFLNQKLKVL
jgi:uncharacterized protein (TIGR02646 family)